MLVTNSQKSFESFDQIINKIRESPKPIRDKGTLFEYMAQAYLKIEYRNHFSHVWMLKEVPRSVYVNYKKKSYHIPHIDRGTDLVAQVSGTGELVAVQAKFYNPNDTVSKPAVDSFIANLGQECFDRGIWFTSQYRVDNNAKAMMKHTSKKISTVTLPQLEKANIDWSKFDTQHLENNETKDLRFNKKKRNLRPYQKTAVKKSIRYYRHYYQDGDTKYSRGKLIMAPGTGKTYTSLNIAEALQCHEHKQDFYVLYLVPSIQLLTQTLFSWGRDVDKNIDMVQFAVTSDNKATNDDDVNDDFKPYPATTNADDLVKYYKRNPSKFNKKRMFVIFSTYQSIDVIHQAQNTTKSRKNIIPDFDLIVADEAHRTAVYHTRGHEGYFSKVHSNKNVRSQLRLYQTATPKVYGEKARRKGKENNIVLANMNDPKIYGSTIFRYTFGQAVDAGWLTDFKVQVLTMDKAYVSKDMQNVLNSDNQGIPMSDYGKILGTINAMLKRKSFSNQVSGTPMKRAIAFATVNDNTAVSSKNRSRIGAKQIANEANEVITAKNKQENGNGYHIKFQAVNGGMNAMEREHWIHWLSTENIPHNEARVLSNVRFLGEGIDVPNLDAVIFFAPKQSQINIIQTVGRVMRRFTNRDTGKRKRWGYIILPIVVPYGADVSKILRNSNYDSIWKILNALRSVDERLDAEVNALKFNNKNYKPKHIDIIGQNSSPDRDLNADSYNEQPKKGNKEPVVHQTSLPLNWNEFQGAIYGEILKHVGNKHYLSEWSDDVRYIARDYVGWIGDKVALNSDFKKAFNHYLTSLKYSINNSIGYDQAINMIAQHIITEPVFDALFNHSNFAENPVSKAMNYIVQQMNKIGFKKKQKSLKSFYDSVKMRADNIDDLSHKQEFIRSLYGDFFKKTFSKTTSKLGIVFTPVPIVNFIVRSVNYALYHYFNHKSIASKRVKILDPFVGTGTFITQALQYLKILKDKNKINRSDIKYKYYHDFFCNEIILLSYYIANINIESVFNAIMGQSKYQEFPGSILTDTFEIDASEYGKRPKYNKDIFNGKRLSNELNEPITVIMSNPPYANINKNDITYSKLDDEIKNTYMHFSKYPSGRIRNSYIRALRWASDCIGDNGIIGFVTNAKFINSKSADGIRKCLYNEFNYLYIYNLRGNARTSGMARQKEGDPIFGQGSRSPIAISILIKDDSNNHKLFYKDIGNYLSRSQKFQIINKNKSISSIKWENINPDINNNWIDKLDKNYQKFVPLNLKECNSIFPYHALGVQTKRDAIVYGFSKKAVINNVKYVISIYNKTRCKLFSRKGLSKKLTLKHLNNKSKIKWTPKLFRRLKHNKVIKYNKDELIYSLYRPFTKKWLYYDNDLVEGPGKYRTSFGKDNIVIDSTGAGANREFSALASKYIPESGVVHNGEGFMRYNNQMKGTTLFSPKKDNINRIFANKLGLSTTNTFYYIYGILNSPEYKNKYKNNLNRELARIPIVKNVSPFVKVGRKLMWLHTHYENVIPRTDYLHVIYSNKTGKTNFNVTKIKHGKYHSKYGKKYKDPNYNNLNYFGRKSDDLTTIIFNSDIIIKGIPLKAYNYVVNGKAAIDWILDQYCIKRNGIVDNPNKFSKDPKYIFNLLLKVINVSLKTVDLVNKLPKMQIIDPDRYKSVNNQKDLSNSSNNKKSAKATTSEANTKSAKSANNMNSLNNKIEQLTLKLSSYTNHMNHKGKK